MVVTFGADPELFLARSNKVVKEVPSKIAGETRKANKTEITPVLVTGLIGGTKHDPLPLTNTLKGWEHVRDIPEGAMIQEDGAAAEFNIKPQNSTSLMVEQCRGVVDSINQWASLKGLRIWKDSSAAFTENYRRSHPKAFEVGCDPDIDAYTGQVRKPPDAVIGSLVRYAGGHIHVGYDKNLIPPHIVVQFMDLVLGLPSVFLDSQGPRRQFYGKAGSYRVKDYGVEYRTLSNFWVPGVQYHSTVGTHFCFALSELMTAFRSDMASLERLHAIIPWKEVQEAINTENQRLALSIIDLGCAHARAVMSGAKEFVKNSAIFRKEYQVR